MACPALARPSCRCPSAGRFVSSHTERRAPAAVRCRAHADGTGGGEVAGPVRASSRRSVVMGVAGLSLLSATPAAVPVSSATVLQATLQAVSRVPALASLAPLSVYLDSIRNARKELDAIRSRVQLVDASGAQLPFDDLQSSLQSGALARLRDASLGADQYLGEDNLEDMWKVDDPPGSSPEVSPLFGRKSPSGVNTFQLPAINRPNDFLCLVFSCFNDPRQPPSTNHLLTYKMLQEGLTMGSRGDKRITPGGITSIIDDVSNELDYYLKLAEERQAMLGNLSR